MTPDAPGGRWPIRTLEEADLPAVARLWNADLGASHPLDPTGLRRWWRSWPAARGLGFGVDQGGELVGALLARAPEIAWSPPEVGYVGLLAVAPHARRRGIGHALWEAATEALRERGRAVVRIGADPDHLVPGVPAVAPAGAWRFLAARGCRFGALEADLVVDLRAPARSTEATRRTASVQVAPAPSEVVPAVARWFPGRWADEVARAADDGVTLLGAFADGDLVGFAMATSPADRRLGPGLLWADRMEGRPGGLGPLGVDPARRGRGLGLAMVAAAAQWHAEHGTELLVLDWTTLWAFYGRLGARVWRVYQRAEAPLTGSPEPPLG